MAAQNVELVRRAYEAWNTGDLSWVLDHVTDDFTIRPLSRYIDLAELYEGKDGFLRFAQAWSDAWEEIKLDVERVEDLGGGRVMTLLTHRGRGHASGADVTEEVGHLVRVRDGMVAELRVIEGWGPTIDAAGVGDRSARS